jgi:hypothetical protein
MEIYTIQMKRDRHPNKEVEEALQYAEKNNWRVEKSKGSSSHAWGRIYCPTKDHPCISSDRCVTSIWSTPASPANHAKQLKRLIKRCADIQEKRNENDDE